MVRVKRMAIGSFDVKDQGGTRQIVRVFQEVVISESATEGTVRTEGSRYYIGQNGKFLNKIDARKYCYSNNSEVILISDDPQDF